jgi:RimJ/RimL family protein N-acetyltransferase
MQRPVEVTLSGASVRLEPLRVEHADGLLASCADERIWPWMVRGAFTSREDVLGFVAQADEFRAKNLHLTFAIVRQSDGAVVGSTRYLDILPDHGGIEIGYTFLSTSVWRTAINTECKFLLLRHAFETLGAERVCLKTDGRNVRSQAAIERIGGVREGVLRRNMKVRDGFIRDTVVYSILKEEWPGVRDKLLREIERKR